MARISTYATDTLVTANDKWIGTDFSGGITKNFSPQILANYFNESGTIGVSNQINFKYYNEYVGGRPVGSITTISLLPSFSSLSTIKISEKNSGLKYIMDILNTFIHDTIMISDASNPNNFGIYILQDVQQDLIEPLFYNVHLQFIEGHGGLEDIHIYSITSISSGDSSDKTHVHIQEIASNQWDITHSLNKYPSVSIVDVDNNYVTADIEYTSLNTVTLRFSPEFSGKAFFN